MKKTTLLFITAIFCTAIAYSQASASFGYDRDIVMEDMNEYVRLIGADSDGFYALRIDAKDNLFLEFFNGATMNRESTNQLILPMVGGINADYVAMFYLDSKLILFTQVVNNTIKEKSLYIQHVNKSGQIIGEPKIIGKLTNQNIIVDFNVELTPNQQNMFVHYNRPFQTYNEEPFFFKVYDAELKEIYNNLIKLPLVDEAFEIIQYEISNTGNIYMLAKIEPDARRAKRMKVLIYDYKLLVFDNTTKLVEDYDVKGKKYILVDAIFGLDDDENVDIFGFLVRKGKTNFEGIYHQKLNTQTKEFEMPSNSKQSDYMFARSETPAFRSERLLKFYDEMYNYKLLDVLQLSNGGSVVIAEHFNHWVDSIIVPGSKEVIYNYYDLYNDVLVAYCSAENNMEWMTRIPKSQYSYDYKGELFSSVAYTAVGEKVFLFYNDHKKNVKLLEQQNLDGYNYKSITAPDRKGMAVVVSIFSDGKAHGTTLFTKKNKKYKIIPELMKGFNYKYYMCTQNGSKVKFALFTGQ
ncbi:MAG: hypothetical protein PHW82_08495 [Bacteroidales bacterium]|nr:hypothetical protein [Bacteroidales bacterium]